MSSTALQPRVFRDISALLYRWTGIRLHGKEQMVESRLTPRLRRLGVGFTDYIARLERATPDSPDGIDFINALTTNKTSFFREPHHFDYLRTVLFPALIRAAATGGKRTLRLWSAACSSGEEPYSLAMLCRHHLPASDGWDVQILATDIDTAVLDKAKRGVYDREAIATVPAQFRGGAFGEPDAEGRAAIAPEVARLVHFARANLIAEPFPVRGQFHAILCRNVMIYFDRTTQERVVDNLTRQLRPGGYLIVGHSESLVAPHLARAPGGIGVYLTRPAPDGEAAAAAPPAPTIHRPAPTIHRPAPPPRRARPPRLALPRKAAPARPAERAATAFAGVATPRTSITVGEIAVSAEPRLITTLLGSCVSACLYDPVARIGGMNHFLLPGSDLAEAMPGRFGVHAMELLINKLMRLGAERERLVAKAFGAARVASTTLVPVAEHNAAFIREFLARESIPLVVERLGGTQAREITLDAQSGKVAIRVIERSERIVAEELEVVSHPVAAAAPFDADAALF